MMQFLHNELKIRLSDCVRSSKSIHVILRRYYLAQVLRPFFLFSENLIGRLASLGLLDFLRHPVHF